MRWSLLRLVVYLWELCTCYPRYIANAIYMYYLQVCSGLLLMAFLHEEVSGEGLPLSRVLHMSWCDYEMNVHLQVTLIHVL